MSIQTQTLAIPNVPPDQMKKLIEKANESGKTPEEYALELIVSGLDSTGGMTFDQILAPFRREVKESGISDEDLDQLFRRARQDYAREQGEND
jgi:hypothetical protein